MDDDEAPVAYPVPEATIAGEPAFLAALAAVILGVLVFWRRRGRARRPSKIALTGEIPAKTRKTHR